MEKSLVKHLTEKAPAFTFTLLESCGVGRLFDSEIEHPTSEIKT